MLNFDNLNIILFILPIYQVLFYVVQLITLKRKSDSSRFPLGFLMLLMLLYLIIISTGYLGYLLLYKYLYIIQLPILLAIIPTYYLYIGALTNYHNGRFSRMPLVYYLPSIFTLVLNVIALVSMSPDQIELFLCPGCSLTSDYYKITDFTTITFFIGNVVFIAMQVTLTIFLYFRYMHKLINIKKSNSTYLPYFQLSWSHIIVLSIISFVIICSVMNLLIPLFNHILSTIFNVAILISSGLAGYYSLRQDKMFLEVASIDTKGINANHVKDHSDKSNDKRSDFVSDEDARKIIASLQHHLVTDKPYLNRKLGVNELAKALGITKQKLTYVVNVVMETNFYGIINRYRILEAKEMLKNLETQNYKIDVISQIVGFQSKSSFNACFKQLTGLTPSEFRKTNSKGKLS